MVHFRAAQCLTGIALRGYGMDEDVRRSCESGFVTRRVKPTDSRQLRFGTGRHRPSPSVHGRMADKE